MGKCENFRREFTPTKREIEFCPVDASNHHCAGFFEFCDTPDKYTEKTEKIIMEDEHGYLVEDDPSQMVIWEEDLEWKDNVN